MKLKLKRRTVRRPDSESIVITTHNCVVEVTELDGSDHGKPATVVRVLRNVNETATWSLDRDAHPPLRSVQTFIRSLSSLLSVEVTDHPNNDR